MCETYAETNKLRKTILLRTHRRGIYGICVYVRSRVRVRVCRRACTCLRERVVRNGFLGLVGFPGASWASWGLLGPPGASCGLLVPSGASWGLLGPLGASRGFLKPPAASWGLLRPPGASWGLAGPPGTAWGLPGLPGASWVLLGRPDPWARHVDWRALRGSVRLAKSAGHPRPAEPFNNPFGPRLSSSVANKTRACSAVVCSMI